MNITLQPLSNTGINQQTINKNKRINNNRFGLQADTVSFKALNRNLEEALNKSIEDVINGGFPATGKKRSFHKLLNSSMPEIMKEENFINKGRESKVYRISDKYVAKIRRGTTSKSAVHFYNNTALPDKRFSSLNFYYGEPLIRLGNVEILKNATPTENYRFCGAKFSGRRSYNTMEEKLDYENNYLPLCSSLPQESFDDFAKGLRDLNHIRKGIPFINQRSFIPDVINPNNILIADNKFRLVDKLEPVKTCNPNTIHTMIEPLIIRMAPEVYPEKNLKLEPYRNTILQKSLLAAEKWYLPLDGPIKDEFSDYYIGMLTSRTEGPRIIDALQEMREAHVPVHDRIDFINEYYSKVPTINNM